MTLSPGVRLGPYEITGAIGAGGMGEVYRGRDATLNRDVAIKVLPAAMASDADVLARFKREAQVLASLNHPNIAHVYGFEGATLPDGSTVHFLAMEMVEGEDLAERLRRGAMPVDEATAIARQIAEGLEEAHERGIIHRDLKPANVKVTPDGKVKILDFGLAKALEGDSSHSPANSQLSHSPTMSRHMTEAGMILGTAAYMSPEQARGKAVDKRTDIWAFGVVLFEMLTGRRLFTGETVSDVLASVLTREPDWGLLPTGGSGALRHVLARCLAKDPKQRFHSVADVRLDLEETLRNPRSDGAVMFDRAHSPGMSRRERIAWGLLAASVAVTGFAMSQQWGESERGVPPTLRVSILPAEISEVGVPAISPDGRRVAYPARRSDGMPLIWVRDLDKSLPRALEGTEGGNRLFWSPDSKRVGFVVGDVLKHISADGGPVKEIARRVGVGAAWSADDVILFQGKGGDIRRINASGGEDKAATIIQAPDWEHAFPSMLPDGRHFLFTAKHWAGLAETGAQGIYIGSIDDPSGSRQLLSELSNGVYAAPGYIVFAREGRLMAAPFEAGAGRVTGEPVDLGESVATESSRYLAALGAANDGALVLRPPPAAALSAAVGQSGTFESELALLRRDGSVASRFGGVRLFDYPVLSPDGRTVVALVQDARTSAADLWSVDVATGSLSPLTSMRSAGGWAGAGVWSQDGGRLAFACQLPGIVDDLCVRDMRTGVVTTVIQSKTAWEHPVAWSPDGNNLLVAFDDYGDKSRTELRAWSFQTSTLSPYVPSSDDGVFSPDARFVAFTSQETGRNEVSVTTFPGRRQTWPLTTEGGNLLSWSADGREILVTTLSGHIVAYPVSTADGIFSAGVPQVLIRNVGINARAARASRDHSRILLRLAKDADKDRGEIRLLFGWQKGLR
jgi:serine/threonine protein kinase